MTMPASQHDPELQRARAKRTVIVLAIVAAVIYVLTALYAAPGK